MQKSPVHSTEVTPPVVTKLNSGTQSYTSIRIAPSHSGLHKTIRNPQSMSGWYTRGNKIEPWRWNGTIEHQKWLYLTFSEQPQGLRPLTDIFQLDINETLRFLGKFLGALSELENTEGFEPDGMYLTSTFFDETGTLYFLHPDIAQLTVQNFEQLCPIEERYKIGPLGRKELVPLISYQLQLQIKTKHGKEHSTQDERDESSRTSAIQPHLHRYVPQLSRRIADFLFNTVNRAASSESISEDIRCLSNEIAEWQRGELFEDLHLDGIEQRRKRAYMLEAGLQKKEKRRNFRRKYGSTVFLTAAALVILAFFVSPFIRRAFEPDITEGLQPAEVIELFYNSQNSLDHEAMNECTTGSIGNTHINQVTTLFVISRVRQGVEMKDVFSPAPEWINAGRPDLKDGKFVFGVTEINIEKTGKEEYKANYIRWSTLPPQAEDISSEEKQAQISSTGEVRAFKITELVEMTETSKGWKIDSLKEINREPYNF